MSSTDMFNVIINLKFKIPSKMSIELQYPKGGKRNDASCWWLISSVAGYCKIIDFYFKPFHQLQWLQWGQGERVANRCKLTKRIWRLFLFFDTCRQLSPQKNENTAKIQGCLKGVFSSGMSLGHEGIWGISPWGDWRDFLWLYLKQSKPPNVRFPKLIEIRHSLTHSTDILVVLVTNMRHA